MFQAITERFEELVLRHNGQIVDDLRDRPSGYLSAYFPFQKAEIQRNDIIALGAALKQDENQIVSFHPFTYRLVCTNGALRPQSLVSEKEVYSPEQLEKELDELLFSLGMQTIEADAERFRQLQQQPISQRNLDWVTRSLYHRINRSPVSNRRSSRYQRLRELAHTLQEEFDQNRALRSENTQIQTQFDLVNAVTALANRQHDPADKWELMRLGGELMETLHEEKATAPELFAEKYEVMGGV